MLHHELDKILLSKQPKSNVQVSNSKNITATEIMADSVILRCSSRGFTIQLPLPSRLHIVVVVNLSLFTAPQFAAIDVVISELDHNITIIDNYKSANEILCCNRK